MTHIWLKHIMKHIWHKILWDLPSEFFVCCFLGWSPSSACKKLFFRSIIGVWLHLHQCTLSKMWPQLPTKSYIYGLGGFRRKSWHLFTEGVKLPFKILGMLCADWRLQRNWLTVQLMPKWEDSQKGNDRLGGGPWKAKRLALVEHETDI